MSETKHTPGPWEISAARSPDGYAWVVGGAGDGFGLVAEVIRDADAALIAAAPTMAEFIAAKAAEGDPEAARIMEVIRGHA